MRIKDLISRTRALIEGNVYLAVDDATNNVTQKVDYKTLAQEIIEQYNLSTLAGSAQSVKSALDGIKTDLNVVYGANSIKTLAATDDLLTLDVGMYRVANVLPLNAPSTTYKYGYATKQHRGASGYTYYEFIVGNGNGTDFKRYYGWQYSNSASAIDWIEMAPQSAVDALNSNAYLLSYGTRIPNGTDFNKLVTPGRYYCPTVSAGQSMLNCPVRSAFVMNVELTTGNDVNYVRQTVTIIDSTAGGIIEYIRSTTNNGGTWTAWVHMPTRAEVDALNSKHQLSSNIDHEYTTYYSNGRIQKKTFIKDSQTVYALTISETGLTLSKSTDNEGTYTTLWTK